MFDLMDIEIKGDLADSSVSKGNGRSLADALHSRFGIEAKVKKDKMTQLFIEFRQCRFKAILHVADFFLVKLLRRFQNSAGITEMRNS